jgi:uncharacterized protein (DUF4415 family)
MKRSAGEPYRDIDFSRARRGPVIGPGKTKISIRLDNRVIEHFRRIVEHSGGGNYQTLINDALVAHIQQGAVLDAVRRVVREEISGGKAEARFEVRAARGAGRTRRALALLEKARARKTG